MHLLQMVRFHLIASSFLDVLTDTSNICTLLIKAGWYYQEILLESSGAIDSPLGSKLYPKKSKPLAILPPMVSNGTILLYPEIERNSVITAYCGGIWV